ncbi:MAG: T9SS type A sorting domain-containing protein [Bacteroidales bacterium]|nr:T9SS type A sorting domain-containing protein [Bacteroidales bacterium]
MKNTTFFRIVLLILVIISLYSSDIFGELLIEDFDDDSQIIPGWRRYGHSFFYLDGYIDIRYNNHWLITPRLCVTDSYHTFRFLYAAPGRNGKMYIKLSTTYTYRHCFDTTIDTIEARNSPAFIWAEEDLTPYIGDSIYIAFENRQTGGFTCWIMLGRVEGPEVCSPLVNPTFITVDDDTTADFIHIQDGLNNADNRDTVFVFNGYYLERPTLDGANMGHIYNGLILEGEDPESTTIFSPISYSYYVIGSGYIKEIRNFNIQNGATGILVGGGSTIQNNIFMNNLCGIRLIGPSGGDGGVIDKTVITGCLFSENSIGITITDHYYSPYDSIGQFFQFPESLIICGNTIVDNDTGIMFPCYPLFDFTKNSVFILNDTGFVDDYPDTFDIDLSLNWWGTVNIDSIYSKIYSLMGIPPEERIIFRNFILLPLLYDRIDSTITEPIFGLHFNNIHDNTVNIMDGLIYFAPPHIEEQENKQFSINLMQNFPNPFNEYTFLRFSLNQDADVEIEIYNLFGEKVCGLVSERMAAETYTVRWNAEGHPSGVYFCRLKAGEHTEVKRMLLMK